MKKWPEGVNFAEHGYPVLYIAVVGNFCDHGRDHLVYASFCDARFFMVAAS